MMLPTLGLLSKDADMRAVGRVPYRLLEEVLVLPAGDADSANMLVRQDVYILL